MKSKIIIFVISSLLLINILGCEAFIRKFTRKPKKEDLPKEEMILVPEEYEGTQMTKEESYRKYFLFWKSWQDELINYLSRGSNHKKQIDCAQQALTNMMNLRTLLAENKQKELDVYINQLTDLKDLIVQDIYGNKLTNNRQKAERIRRNMLKSFSYNEIKRYLI